MRIRQKYKPTLFGVAYIYYLDTSPSDAGDWQIPQSIEFAARQTGRIILSPRLLPPIRHAWPFYVSFF